MAEILARYPEGFISPLPSIGILSLEGADAVPFIHRQLSNDIEHLGDSQARLAAYCTPQGQVLALFTVWKDNGKVLLAMPKDIVPSILKRLRIYVLRDKVTISDVSDNYKVYGIHGDDALKALGLSADAPAETYAKTDNETGILIRWQDALNTPRWLLFAKLPVTVPETYLADENAWWLTEIEAGMPRVNLAVQDRFLPQMLNLEPLGGLSFTKGCYPGQEIVSRAKYRGAVRSGLFKGSLPLSGNTLPSVPDGIKLFNEVGNECGTIIMSAVDGKTLHCFAVARFDDVSAGTVRPGSVEGDVITLSSYLQET